MPNDEVEQERLDLMHHLFRMVLDGALYAHQYLIMFNEFSTSAREREYLKGEILWDGIQVTITSYSEVADT